MTEIQKTMTCASPPPARPRKNKRAAELIRFATVGILSNILYFSVLGGLLWINMAIEAAAAIAYATSMVINYLLQRSYTFKSNSKHLHATVKYLLVQFIGMGINSGTLHILVTQLGLPVISGLIVALALVTCWTYLAMRLWVFSDSRHKPS